MTKRAAIVVALLLGAVPIASAQTLRGKAVRPSDGAGVAGVVVFLLDSAGDVAARTLTDEGGEYRVTAPRAGAYRVRTLRIGYEPAMFSAVELRAGTELEQRLELHSLPLMLDTVLVLAKARCEAYEGSSLIASVWEQVRTALTVADLTSREQLLHATVVRLRRAFDARSRLVDQSLTESSGLVTQPWGTLPPDSLRRFGYIYRHADGSKTYYAPDIDALISGNFVQDHCFRFASAPDSTLLGVAFERTHDREDVPEIAGTVWLDRKSAELRRMDFRYMNPRRSREPFVSGATAGGTMDFVRMMNGGWAISKWEIRVPVLRQRLLAGGTSYGESTVETYLSELRVETGALSLVMRGRDTLWRVQ